MWLSDNEKTLLILLRTVILRIFFTILQDKRFKKRMIY
ncbi:hypothetical protein HM1_2019 [Heliomicrobium modesticaldum Ice1]|uniref:Uncharacterized protein n=1 Tax=Heliobacterium modesticaldum (strain ATCC 51547 / Ice1) TaxID=498761 RepID=B0TG80_HELMI|nr:hypothetical protein HM1_2019 [Heliomicrobium modesticaldum Ice1]